MKCACCPLPCCWHAESSAGLEGLDALLPQLTKLTYLSLADTHLDHLPPSLSVLCNLRQLHLYNPTHAQAQARPVRVPGRLFAKLEPFLVAGMLPRLLHFARPC